MAGRGMIPKPAAQRRNRNKPMIEAVTVPSSTEVVMPPADESWHPIAAAWYQALADSAPSALYLPSDWATAYALADAMSREYSPRPVRVGKGDDAETVLMALPVSAAAINSWRLVMDGLGVTEGARRKLRIEVDRPKPATTSTTDGVSWIEEARHRFNRDPLAEYEAARGGHRPGA